MRDIIEAVKRSIQKNKHNHNFITHSKVGNIEGNVSIQDLLKRIQRAKAEQEREKNSEI